MGKYVAENVVKKLIAANVPVKNARVAILGFTFKENCPDTRNTKIIDIYRELQEYGITPVVADPAADAAEAKRLYGIEFVDIATVKDMDAVILAVSHEQFKSLTVADFDKLYSGNNQKVLVDVKAMLNKAEFVDAGYLYWRL
jgi:UDP-N-acetyl-D-galactosamine dehydrogenase